MRIPPIRCLEAREKPSRGCKHIRFELGRIGVVAGLLQLSHDERNPPVIGIRESTHGRLNDRSGLVLLHPNGQR